MSSLKLNTKKKSNDLVNLYLQFSLKIQRTLHNVKWPLSDSTSIVNRTHRRDYHRQHHVTVYSLATVASNCSSNFTTAVISRPTITIVTSLKRPPSPYCRPQLSHNPHCQYRHSVLNSLYSSMLICFFFPLFNLKPLSLSPYCRPQLPHNPHCQYRHIVDIVLIVHCHPYHIMTDLFFAILTSDIRFSWY